MIYKYPLIICFAVVFGIFSNLIGQPSPAGTYSVADRKCTIKSGESGFQVRWDSTEGYSALEYKEDILTGEHIWVEKKRDRTIATFIFNGDYNSGTYVRLEDNEKFNLVKLE